MMNALKGIVISVLSLCIMLSTASLATGEEKYSGFLENYPAFEPDEDRKGAMVYRKAGVDLKPYTKIMIDPVEIWVAQDSKYKGIKPDDLKILADTFRQAIVDALEPVYPVVGKPGPDVLGIRIAITNVYMTKKKRGLLGYTPAGLVVSTAMKSAGDNMSLQDAMIEAELLDSQTNERLGALIDQQSKTGKGKSSLGKLSAVQKGATSWEAIEEILKFYANRLRGRLDTEHGK
jgi:hypothetical protein